MMSRNKKLSEWVWMLSFKSKIQKGNLSVKWNDNGRIVLLKESRGRQVMIPRKNS